MLRKLKQKRQFFNIYILYIYIEYKRRKMEKETTKFEFKVIENNNELVTNPMLRKAPKASNEMMAKFLEFRQAKRFAPKDLV